MLELFTLENAAALVTLTAMEIVLGIDNIVFIAILTSKLPERQRATGRRVGLFLAMFARIALLLSITWVMGLTRTLVEIPWFEHEELVAAADSAAEAGAAHTEPVITTSNLALTGKDLVLLLGGLFLIFKATKEIHHKLEAADEPDTLHPTRPPAASFRAVVAQIVIIDIVFSLDSVITAVGMARAVPVMIAAVVAAVGVMLAFAGAISSFVERHPTIKMLALAFLLLIGVMLVADGLHQHVPRGYVYFAMAFSLGVELLNLRAKKGVGGGAQAEVE